MNFERWLTAECIAAAEGRPPRARSIAMFSNRFFDRRLARAHPAFPLVFFGPIALAALVDALTIISSASVLIAAACGWLGLSLVEYTLHRFVFHRSFPDTRSGKIEAFLTHGYHHAYPDDPDRLVLPPIESIPLAVVIAAVEIAVLGRGLGLATFAGTVLGYIAYDEIHYVLHHHRPRTSIGRWMRRYHLLHHHAPELARFGVSSPLWDFVFGTYGRVGKGARGVNPLRPRP
jgi:dihydroceramide fatty acyl 2-hydroxylase